MNIRTLLIVALLVNMSLVSLTVSHDPTGLGLLSPLLPVAAVTGHSGLLTAGLTGVALLKLKAAAGIAYWLSVRKHKRSRGRKHKGKGHGWGGWNEEKRHRRAVEETEQEEKKIPSVEKPTVDMSEYDPSLDEVLQYDQLGCGMRLVCELSATADDALKDDEKLILALFGRDGKIVHPERASRGKLSYNYAALLGSHSKDNMICSNVYGRCPYSASEIMFSLRDIPA